LINLFVDWTMGPYRWWYEFSTRTPEEGQCEKRVKRAIAPPYLLVAKSSWKRNWGFPQGLKAVISYGLKKALEPSDDEFIAIIAKGP
jgi:hypothetical protein